MTAVLRRRIVSAARFSTRTIPLGEAML